jgi:ubiquinone/menaquinone biosynthesis C-methylase UbiE
VQSPFRLPPVTERLRTNFTWRYYYSGEFGFSRPAVQHVRWRRFYAAAELLIPLPRPVRLLDVGCGPGESTLYLSRALRVPEAIGCDISRDCTWFARQLAAANNMAARFLVGSATKLPVASDTVGLVTTFEMLEHLPHWRVFLAEARRVLHRGGHLLITTPNALSVHAMLKAVYRRARRFDRLNRAWTKDGDFYEAFLSDGHIRRGLADAGFATLATRHVAFVLTVQPDWSLPAIRRVEAWLEQLPGLRRLAVTTVVLARAV